MELESCRKVVRGAMMGCMGAGGMAVRLAAPPGSVGVLRLARVLIVSWCRRLGMCAYLSLSLAALAALMANAAAPGEVPEAWGGRVPGMVRAVGEGCSLMGSSTPAGPY